MDVTLIDTLLVTGSKFLASHFINYFCTKYPMIKVLILDTYNMKNQENIIFQSIRESKNYNFVHGNLRYFHFLKYIFGSYKISHIIHFEDHSPETISFENSLDYVHNHILDVHNLLEVSRQHNSSLLKFIFVSTEQVYGNSIHTNHQPKTEDSRLCPTNWYSATKASAELMALSYFHSFSMPIISCGITPNSRINRQIRAITAATFPTLA